MVCSTRTAKTYRNKVSISILVLFLCCTCDLFFMIYLVSYGIQVRNIFHKMCCIEWSKKTLLFSLNSRNCQTAVKCLMQPSLCSVDGSCVCDKVSWTKLTLASKDGIDSLNPALEWVVRAEPISFRNEGSNNIG